MALPYAHLYTWTEQTLELADVFRKKLEAAGFTESRWSREGRFFDPRNHFQFFRQDTELTALFVNLEPQPHRNGIMVRYGLDSTAFTRMKGDEESLLNWGLGADDACLRWEVSVTTAEDPAAAAQIAAHFRQYQGTPKDELLNVRKELRKVFLNKITGVLKPLGFRKKGAEWRRALPSGHTICFVADKGSYSDSYDFDMFLHSPSGEPRPWGWCVRVVLNLPDLRHPNPFLHHPYDWQVNTDEDLREILDNFLKNCYEPLMAGNIAALPEQLLCRSRACPQEDCPLRCTVK